MTPSLLFILWERISPERRLSFQKFVEQKSFIRFEIDFDSRSLTAFNKKFPPTGSPIYLFFHIGNFYTDTTRSLEIVEGINRTRPDIRQVVYSGGISRVIPNLNDQTVALTLEGKPLKIKCANLNHLCVIDRKVRNDLRTELNLDKAVETLRESGKAYDFFTALRRVNPVAELYLEIGTDLSNVERFSDPEYQRGVSAKIERLLELSDRHLQDSKEQIRQSLCSIFQPGRARRELFEDIRGMLNRLTPT